MNTDTVVNDSITAEDRPLSLTATWQPVASISSARVYGFSINKIKINDAFNVTPDQYFDKSHNLNWYGYLHFFESCLESFCDVCRDLGETRVFIPFGLSLVSDSQYNSEVLQNILRRLGLQQAQVIAVLYETSVQLTHKELNDFLSPWAHRTMFYGYGCNGLEILSAIKQKPDFILLGEEFCRGLHQSPTMRNVVSHILSQISAMGAKTVAANLHDIKDVFQCRDLGFDLFSGSYDVESTSAHHAANIAELYIPAVKEYYKSERRRTNSSEQALIRENIESLPTIETNNPVREILRLFRENPTHHFFPVVDLYNEPLGLIHEQKLKHFIYSHVGKDLLSNRNIYKSVLQFMTTCSTVDINTSTEHILDAFSKKPNAEGIIITESKKYVGFMKASSLLQVIHEKNLQNALDENPLTRLPGNKAIAIQTNKICQLRDSERYIIYFDFDYFKPFNDSYGFRTGDRAIQMFADIIRKQLCRENHFVGHIGGDDFIATIVDETPEQVEEKLIETLRNFCDESRSFFSQEVQFAGGYYGMNRDGVQQWFNLLGCSAVVLGIPSGSILDSDRVSESIAEYKKAAKYSDKNYIFCTVDT